MANEVDKAQKAKVICKQQNSEHTFWLDDEFALCKREERERKRERKKTIPKPATQSIYRIVAAEMKRQLIRPEIHLGSSLRASIEPKQQQQQLKELEFLEIVQHVCMYVCVYVAWCVC